MATRASMSTSAFDACHAAVRTAAASAGLASPRISAAVARTITSSFVRRARSRRSTVALASGVFAAPSAFIVAGHVRRSLSSRYGFHADFGHRVAERAQRGHDRGAHRPVGIRIDARQHLQELRAFDRGERGDRGGAHRR